MLLFFVPLCYGILYVIHFVPLINLDQCSPKQELGTFKPILFQLQPMTPIWISESSHNHLQVTKVCLCLIQCPIPKVSEHHPSHLVLFFPFRLTANNSWSTSLADSIYLLEQKLPCTYCKHSNFGTIIVMSSHHMTQKIWLRHQTPGASSILST
jgi:hypothetical protein